MLHENIMSKDFERFWFKVDSSSGVNGCWRRAGPHTRKGYAVFRIQRDGKRVGIRGHRFAFISIVGDLPPDLPFVLHKCPNGSMPWCVNPAHHGPGTAQENAADRERESRTAKGERHGRSTHPRLTLVQIQNIRTLYAAGDHSQSVLGRMYAVSQPTICRIVNAPL